MRCGRRERENVAPPPSQSSALAAGRPPYRRRLSLLRFPRGSDTLPLRIGCGRHATGFERRGIVRCHSSHHSLSLLRAGLEQCLRELLRVAAACMNCPAKKIYNMQNLNRSAQYTGMVLERDGLTTPSPPSYKHAHLSACRQVEVLANTRPSIVYLTRVVDVMRLLNYDSSNMDSALTKTLMAVLVMHVFVL